MWVTDAERSAGGGGSILNRFAEARLLPDRVMMSSEKSGPVRGDELVKPMEE